MTHGEQNRACPYPQWSLPCSGWRRVGHKMRLEQERGSGESPPDFQMSCRQPSVASLASGCSYSPLPTAIPGVSGPPMQAEFWCPMPVTSMPAEHTWSVLHCLQSPWPASALPHRVPTLGCCFPLPTLLSHHTPSARSEAVGFPGGSLICNFLGRKSDTRSTRAQLGQNASHAGLSMQSKPRRT